jgi:hypothetical protein
MLPPAVRKAIIDHIVALDPVTSGSSAYAGSVVHLDDVTAWAESDVPFTPMNLPSNLEYLRVWVELGDAQDLDDRPLDETFIRQQVAVLWLYPYRDTGEAPKLDFDRAWFALASLYRYILNGWDDGVGIVVDRAPVSMLRPVRVGEAGHILCEIRFIVRYELE